MTEAKRLAESVEASARRRAAQAAAVPRRRRRTSATKRRGAPWKRARSPGSRATRERLSARLGQADDLRGGGGRLRSERARAQGGPVGAEARKSTRSWACVELRRLLDEASAQINGEDGWSRCEQECALRQRRAQPQPEPPADGVVSAPCEGRERGDRGSPPASRLLVTSRPRPAPRWRWRPIRRYSRGLPADSGRQGCAAPEPEPRAPGAYWSG